MKRCLYIFAIFLIMNLIKNEDKIDLSDKNPMVYCLKKVRNYNFEEIKNFILQNQDPEFAIENYPNDISFYNCLEEVEKNNN